MIKRLFVICMIFVLLLPVPASAFDLWEWERMSAWWVPEYYNQVDEYEITMRFDPPSSYSGIFETETILTERGGDTSLVLEPGIYMEIEEREGADRMLMFFYVIEKTTPKHSWMLIDPTDIGYWRRHHQFRWQVKHYVDTGQIEVKVYDCDAQEMLFWEIGTPVADTEGWHMSAFDVTLEYSDPEFDAKAVWEGHWTVHEDTYAYRWDRAPWEPDHDPFWYHVDEEADRIEHRPALHLYDDHPKACTGYIYWPTCTGQEVRDEEPLFDGKDGDLSPNELAELTARLGHPNPGRVAVLEFLKAQGDVPRQPEAPLGPPDPPPEYPKNAFLAHVFNGLEGQAHWNRVDMCWNCTY